MATIKEYRNSAGKIVSYQVRAVVGRDEHGNAIRRSTTFERPKNMSPARERREIQRLTNEWELKQIEDFQKAPDKIDKKKITLGDFIENHWWKDNILDGRHTPTSEQFYKYMYVEILDYFGKNARLERIDAEWIKKYINWLYNDAKTKTGKPYSASTIGHLYGTLRSILRYAERMDYITVDPTRKLSQNERPHREKKEVEFLDMEQAKEFLECLKSEPLLWRCLMNILITCGLRRGEVVGLQWGDLNKKDKTLTIQRNITIDKKSSDHIHVGKTKTKKNRTIPISDRVLLLLKEHHKEQIKRYGILLPTAYIFNSEVDPYKPMYPSNPTKWQASFVKRHNLPKVSPHDLRHTAATLALESGASIKQVQELLGHSDPTTTLTFYTGISEKAKRDTIEGIENLLSS